MPIHFKNRLNCTSKGNVPVLCRLLPFGFPYDITEIQKDDGKTLRVFFAAQSTDAIIYVTVIIAIYFVIFVGFLVFTLTRGRDRGPGGRGGRRRDPEAVRKRRDKRKRKRSKSSSLRSKAVKKSTAVVVCNEKGDIKSKLASDGSAPDNGVIFV